MYTLCQFHVRIVVVCTLAKLGGLVDEHGVEPALRAGRGLQRGLPGATPHATVQRQHAGPRQHDVRRRRVLRAADYRLTFLTQDTGQCTLIVHFQNSIFPMFFVIFRSQVRFYREQNFDSRLQQVIFKELQSLLFFYI